MKEDLIFIIKMLLLVFLPSFIIFILFLNFLAPFGKLSTYNFVATLPNAENFSSLNKTDDKLELGGLILKNKSTRFSLNNQKDLQNIKFKFSYKPGQKEIKLGIRGQESDPFFYKTLFFEPLNELSWDKTEQNGITLYQKNKTFESLSSFLGKIPTDKKIGTYQVDSSKLVSMIFPKEENKKTVIETPIRGNATAYVLFTGGNLNIGVSKQDINMYEGSDIFTMTLSLDGSKVAETKIDDDGFVDTKKNETKTQTGNISVADAKAGVYKLEIKYESEGSDSYISKMEINSSKVIFGGSVLVYKNIPATFYTDSTKITTSTSWDDSIQSLKVDDKADLEIKNIKDKFDFDLTKVIKDKAKNELYKIKSPKGRMYFGTDSYFSFSADSFFDPEIIKIQKITANDSQTDIEQNFDYVLTTAPQVKSQADWLVSDLDIGTSEFKFNGDKIFFSLEIPDLDKQGGSLEIKDLKVSLVSK